MTKVVTIITILVSAAVALFLLSGLRLSHTNTLVSPIATSSAHIALQPHDAIIYGFAPYWEIADLPLQPELTDVAYFSVTINPDGTLNQEASDIGYQRLSSTSLSTLLGQARSQKVQTDLVVSMFDNEQIEQFLMDPNAHIRFVRTLIPLLETYGFRGINLDIEYQGAAPNSLKDAYTSVCRTIRQHNNHPEHSYRLSIDVYASAISGNSIWDIKDLSDCADLFVIMGYDFHRASSQRAGPVAPLIAEGEVDADKNIMAYLQKYLEVIPAHQILLGVPFYGYEWQTLDDSARSHTLPRTGATASFQRIQQLLVDRDLDITQQWEQDTLSPYLTFTKDDQQRIIFYENEQSLRYKLTVVRDLQLGGIAIWALGYEGQHRQLWNQVRDVLQPL